MSTGIRNQFVRIDKYADVSASEARTVEAVSIEIDQLLLRQNDDKFTEGRLFDELRQATTNGDWLKYAASRWPDLEPRRIQERMAAYKLRSDLGIDLKYSHAVLLNPHRDHKDIKELARSISETSVRHARAILDIDPSNIIVTTPTTSTAPTPAVAPLTTERIDNMVRSHMAEDERRIDLVKRKTALVPAPAPKKYTAKDFYHKSGRPAPAQDDVNDDDVDASRCACGQEAEKDRQGGYLKFCKACYARIVAPTEEEQKLIDAIDEMCARAREEYKLEAEARDAAIKADPKLNAALLMVTLGRKALARQLHLELGITQTEEQLSVVNQAAQALITRIQKGDL